MKNIKDMNGIAGWKALLEEYEPGTTADRLGDMRDLMKPEFGQLWEFSTTWKTWGAEIKEFEDTTKEVISPRMRLAVLRRKPQRRSRRTSRSTLCATLHTPK